MTSVDTDPDGTGSHRRSFINVAVGMTTVSPRGPSVSTLSTEALVRGLTCGIPIAPYSLSARVLNSAINHVRAQKMTLNTRSDETKRLYALLSDSLQFLRGERLQAMAGCDIYLLPLPITLAFSEVVDSKPVIVIPSGFVDLIACTLCASHVESLIPEQLKDFYLFGQRLDMSLAELFANALFLMRLRFYTDCELLPDFRAVMTQDLLKTVHAALSGAVLFVILHEIGHVALGHFDGGRPRPVQHSLAVPERLGKLKKQELDADQFARDSLVDAAGETGKYWQNFAFEFHTQMEMVTGERHTSHPLAINRRSGEAIPQEEWGGTVTAGTHAANFNTIRQKFLDTEAEILRGRNRFIETPRERVLGVLCEVLAFLKDNGTDLTAMVSEPWSPWIDLYDPRALD